jgi:hypothetical protein
MYASLRRYRMGAGSVDDLMHRVDVDFADALAQQPGFVAYQAVDCSGDEVLSITLYRDEAGAAESNELAAEWVRENLGEFELERTEVIGGEVMVSRAALRCSSRRTTEGTGGRAAAAARPAPLRGATGPRASAPGGSPSPRTSTRTGSWCGSAPACAPRRWGRAAGRGGR